MPFNLADVFISLAPSLPSLFNLVRAFCVLLGLGLIVHAILKIRHSARKSSDPSTGPHAAWQAFFGVLLINLDTLIGTVAETAFGEHFGARVSPLSYTSASTLGHQTAVAFAVLAFIQFVGFVAVAKGVTELNRLTNGKPDATLGKGLTHILGGVMACNITPTAAMLASIFGFDSSFLNQIGA